MYYEEYFKKHWPSLLFSIIIIVLVSLSTLENLSFQWVYSVDIWINQIFFSLFTFNLLLLLTRKIKNVYLQQVISLFIALVFSQTIHLEFTLSKITVYNIIFFILMIFYTFYLSQLGFYKGTKSAMFKVNELNENYFKQVVKMPFDKRLDLIDLYNEAIDIFNDKPFLFKIIKSFPITELVENRNELMGVHFMSARTKLIHFFNENKNNWFPTNRRPGDERLGNTLEDLLGVQENNLQAPDFEGVFELKAQRSHTTSRITLFTKSPTNKRGINSKLRLEHGYDELDLGYNILYSSIPVKGTYNSKAGKFFYLELNDELKQLVLKIKDTESSKSVYDLQPSWSYEALKHIIDAKLKNIAYFIGEEKTNAGQAYVKYTKLILLKNLTFERIKDAFIKNDIILDLKLGVYKSGKNEGKHHDHGTGFRITIDKLKEYCDYEIIE